MAQQDKQRSPQDRQNQPPRSPSDQRSSQDRQNQGAGQGQQKGQQDRDKRGY